MVGAVGLVEVVLRGQDSVGLPGVELGLGAVRGGYPDILTWHVHGLVHER